MTKRYVPYIPKKLKDGLVLVHNHVRPDDFTPDYPPGLWGFRIWTQTLAEYPPLKVCHCEYAPHLPVHYRVDLEKARQHNPG
jgi:hypothetical protein